LQERCVGVRFGTTCALPALAFKNNNRGLCVKMYMDDVTKYQMTTALKMNAMATTYAPQHVLRHLHEFCSLLRLAHKRNVQETSGLT